jgi:hypothetical protein
MLPSGILRHVALLRRTDVSEEPIVGVGTNIAVSHIFTPVTIMDVVF